jgi:phosphoglycolate phosphatase
MGACFGLAGGRHLRLALQPANAQRHARGQRQDQLPYARGKTRVTHPIRAVLFDLDGTLLDSAPDLVAALNRVRESEGLQALGVAEMSTHVSHGAVGLLTAGMPAAEKATFESWRKRFLEHYAENLFRDSSLYDGVPELLDFLGSSGIPWGIVTNKTEALTWPIIEAAFAKDAVSCVVCGDTLKESKPDPAPVRLACELLDVAPEYTLFVGDDSRDLAAGMAAGTQTASIHYGYGSDNLDERLVARSIQVHHASELIAVIRAD